jgi:hypothetical protein
VLAAIFAVLLPVAVIGAWIRGTVLSTDGYVTAGPRPEPPGPLSATTTFGWRALLKIRHVPEQLLDVIAIPVVFTLMFTYLFGGALAGSPTRYLQFILPGTLVMAVLLITIYAGVGLNTDASRGVSYRFRSLPLWRPAPIAGALLGDAARYLLAASLMIALGVAMGFRPAGGVPGVLAVARPPRPGFRPPSLPPTREVPSPTNAPEHWLSSNKRDNWAGIEPRWA